MIESRLEILTDKMSPKLMGAGFMLLWGLAFSTTMSLAKSLSPEVDSIIILFMRYFFGLIVFSPFLLQAGIKSFTTKRPLLHLLRVLSVIGAMGCAYYAYRNLPLALATSIGMTGPLFTTVMSFLLLRDRVSLAKWFVIIVGYFGVIVMMHPHEVTASFAVWVELFANLFAAFTIICTKILSRTERTVTIMFYTNTVTTFIVGFMCFFFKFCSIPALRYATPSFLAPFEYTRLCFAAPIGYIFFQEVPSHWTLMGSFIIIGATYVLTRLEIRALNLKSG